jgi:hypothetical protein
VPERVAFEYALIRIVPRVERGESLNAGVMLICRPRRFLQARIELDRSRLRAFAPYVDDESIAGVERQLDSIVAIAAGDPAGGPIAALSLSERWHWLTAPASTIVQPGPVHTGLCSDPAACLDHLFATLVAVPDLGSR